MADPATPIQTQVDQADLRVCDENDPDLQAFHARDGYTFHARNNDTRRAQFVEGHCDVDQDGHDLGGQHGYYYVLEWRAVLNGESTQIECAKCHANVPLTSETFYTKKEDGDPVPNNSIPACNTCHFVHGIFRDLDSLIMTDISVRPDGNKMSTPPDAENPEKSPVPPMIPTLGCPTCHGPSIGAPDIQGSMRPPVSEPDRHGSSARYITDVVRCQPAGCAACHPAVVACKPVEDPTAAAAPSP